MGLCKRRGQGASPCSHGEAGCPGKDVDGTELEMLGSFVGKESAMCCGHELQNLAMG